MGGERSRHCAIPAPLIISTSSSPYRPTLANKYPTEINLYPVHTSSQKSYAIRCMIVYPVDGVNDPFINITETFSFPSSVGVVKISGC